MTKYRTKSLPHLLLSTLLYAPTPWIRRRLDERRGILSIEVVPARLRDRLATNYDRLDSYVQWLVDRDIASNVRKSPGLLQLDIKMAQDWN